MVFGFVAAYVSILGVFSNFPLPLVFEKAEQYVRKDL